MDIGQVCRKVPVDLRQKQAHFLSSNLFSRLFHQPFCCKFMESKELFRKEQREMDGRGRNQYLRIVFLPSLPAVDRF